MSLLRKPMKRVQGVKILCYGVDGSGKSVFGLSFPQVAVLDSLPFSVLYLYFYS